MKLFAYLSSAERNMEQIRNTMMQHEALFKEQVEALHRLYGIQRSAMQEMRKRVYSHHHPQVLAVNCGSVVLENKHLQGPGFEGKAFSQAYASGHSYKEERLSLSLQSPWMSGRGVETSSRGGQSKFVRDFDLEKIPEDCMDGSGSQTEPGSLDRDQASAGKVCEVDVKKFDTTSHNSNSNSDKKPMSSNQGSSEFITQLDLVKTDKLHPERNAEQIKESKFKVSTELVHQYIESESTGTISTGHKKLEEQLRDYVGGFSFTNCPLGSSQGSCESKNQNGLRSLSSETNSSSGKQRLESGALTSDIYNQNENSGNGSNEENEGEKLEKRDSKCTKDVQKPSFSSTICDSEMKVTESNSCANSRTNTAKPFEDDSYLHDASESIAAEILLSFVPRRPQVNPQGARVKAEPSKSDNEDICEQRCAKSGGIDESIKWINSISRRRTLRRPR